MEEFIPIVMFLVFGAIAITGIYFKSREKQMVIERGLDVDVIKEIFKKKDNPYGLLKAGIILLFFGLGLGIGLLIDFITDVKEAIPFLIIVGFGLGFIIAHYTVKKAEEKDKKLNG